MANKTQSDVLIVGSGITGLMAARTLTGRGLTVTVIERDEQPGGRMATYTIGPGMADVGAQFFTVSSPVFETWVNQWIDEDRVFEWSQRWSRSSVGATPFGSQPRYAARGGMCSLIDHLAADLDVRTRSRLVAIAPNGPSWEAIDEKSKTYEARAVLLTPPIPLALDLLKPAQITLPDADRAALEAITYMPCLAGLFWINSTLSLPEPGAIHLPNAQITWIADNRHKGISPNATIITVHAGPEYSRQLWHRTEWEILAALEASLRLYKDPNTHTIERQLKAWQYAMPIMPHPDRFYIPDNLPPLAFAGDAFGGPRVEGAALSGLAAGAALAARLA
ncbi:MAG: FAD-dependent oxidoreductase [Anaerolineae bacterium]|nr:FAD-dependent oxidoreductase [Anaerolineae bacterium]